MTNNKKHFLHITGWRYWGIWNIYIVLFIYKKVMSGGSDQLHEDLDHDSEGPGGEDSATKNDDLHFPLRK